MRTVRQVLLVGVWFGIVTGLLEGVGLLLFQNINWERWGPMMHVTARILWISPLVDVVLFSFLVLIVAGVAKLFSRLSAIRISVFLLTTLAVYDWLALTERLYPRSCWLLALGVAVSFDRWFVKHEFETLRFWKRTLPWMTTAAVLVLAVIEGGNWLKEKRELAKLPPATSEAPNVLMIVVDTLRADHLSSYGYSSPTSPNMDRLAKQGVRFENAVSASSWTFPSHVSLVTGRYIFEHGIGNVPKMSLLGPDQPSFGGFPTIGEVMMREGYRTGAFSANRTYFTENVGFDRGFTHFEDYFHSPVDMFARTLFGKGLVRLYVKRIKKQLMTEWSRYGGAYGVRKYGDEVNKEVLDWVDRDSSRPFFAFLNYFDVHDPYGGKRTYSKDPWDHDEYDNGIKYVDQCIGDLTRELQRRGLAGNTVVIITSDHGESLGEHGSEGHGRTLYWEVIHVPLIIWYPGHVPAGVSIARPVSNVSIAATLTDLTGTEENIFRGPSLKALWTKPETAKDWPNPVAEISQRLYITRKDEAADRQAPSAVLGPMKTLITPEWQLIIHKKFGDQLYDWVKEPGETSNLIQTTAGQEVARNLVSEMNDVLADSSKQSNRKIAAIDLHPGPFKTHNKPGKTGATVRVNDYYRLRAAAGSQLTVQVHADRSRSGPAIDAMLTIEDASGKIYRTCRNPGDDKISPPGVRDLTPEAPDDICINDDIDPGINTDSRLEMQVPGQSGSSVELYMRVLDWNGSAEPGMNYQITVSSTRQDDGFKASSTDTHSDNGRN